MKRVLGIVFALALMVTMLIPLAISAADSDSPIVLNCAPGGGGVISGEAAIDLDANGNHTYGIQTDKDGKSMLGLSGTSDYPTMDTTVTFNNVSVSKDGIYSFTLLYDTKNDVTRKVDLLVDGTRYNFTVDTTVTAWKAGLYTTIITAPLTTGTHTIAVTTSKDFYRGTDTTIPTVKSVNVETLTVTWNSALTSTTLTCKDGNITVGGVTATSNAVAGFGEVEGVRLTPDSRTGNYKAVTTVAFSNVTIAYDGYYKVTLTYDATNDVTRKADLLVDGKRYSFPILDKSQLPSTTGTAYFTADVIVPILAGTHVLSVTTPLDMDADPTSTACVASVNVFTLKTAYSTGMGDTYMLECEKGVIGGEAATEMKNGVLTYNIQTGQYGGATVVGMSGSDTDKTFGTTITFTDVIRKEGNYTFTLSYDTTNDTTKKVDLLIDGTRYNFPLVQSTLPSTWRAGLYNVTLTVPLTAGKHTFVVSTSLDFNRDSTNTATYVKSVNADCLTVQYESAIEPTTTVTSTTTTTTTTTSTATTTTTATTFTPKTFEAENAPSSSGTKDSTGIIGSPSSSNDHIIWGNDQTLAKGASYKLVVYAKLLDSNCVGDSTKTILNFDGCKPNETITGADFPTANTYYAIEVPIDLTEATASVTTEIRFWYFPDSGATVKIDKVMLMLSSDTEPDPVQDSDSTTSSTTASTTSSTTVSTMSSTAVSTTSSTTASATSSTTAATTATSKTATTATTASSGYTVTGQLLSNGTPVANAKLELHSTTAQTATTDENGYFTFSNVEAGAHTLAVTSGSVTGTVSFDIVPDSTITSPTLSENGSKIAVPSLTKALSMQFSLTDSGTLTISSVNSTDSAATTTSTTATNSISPKTGDAAVPVCVLFLLLSLISCAVIKYSKRKTFSM